MLALDDLAPVKAPVECRRQQRSAEEQRNEADIGAAKRELHGGAAAAENADAQHQQQRASPNEPLVCTVGARRQRHPAAYAPPPHRAAIYCSELAACVTCTGYGTKAAVAATAT